ncbi:MAG: FtsH protease activity modulator HflK [Candidatus Alcyoniella australis]|nr:FtsH protease activity modulator HflK [Candidatus Alcyoniella australis]
MAQSRRLRLLSLLCAAALLLIYLASGLYIVDYNQQGVVRRFGAVTENRVPPGIHYHLPWPVERVDRPNVTDLKQRGIGFEVGQEQVSDIAGVFQRQFLTGDRNWIVVMLVVRYTINDPAAFLLNTFDPHELVRISGEAAVTRRLAAMAVDDALTTDKSIIAAEVMRDIQADMDAYSSGLSISSMQVDQIINPRGVAASFNEVSSAREDRSRLINEADGYANQAMPRARAEANRARSEGETYQQERVNRATGEAERFKLLAAEVGTDRRNAYTRLYYQTMDQIWPRLRKYVIGARDRDGLTITLYEPGLPQPAEPDKTRGSSEGP